MNLKHLSDGFFVLAVALLVAAVVTSQALLYVLAAVAFVAAVVATSVRRKQHDASKAVRKP